MPVSLEYNEGGVKLVRPFWDYILNFFGTILELFWNQGARNQTLWFFTNLGTGTLVIVPERNFNQSSCSKKFQAKRFRTL